MSEAGTTLTIGSAITVRGHSGYVGYSPEIGGSLSNIAVVNEGTIEADVSGGTITVYGTGNQNVGNAQCRSTAATLSVQGTLTNHGYGDRWTRPALLAQRHADRRESIATQTGTHRSTAARWTL